MQSWPEASDLSARIAEVRIAGAALEEVRRQLDRVGGQGAAIAADTRWSSHAMSAYERDVEEWRGALADLGGELAAAVEAVRRVVDEMVLAQLLRSAVPGTAVPR
jgi:hypothetical protein